MPIIQAHSVERIAYRQNLSAKRYSLNAKIFFFSIIAFWFSYCDSYAVPCYGTKFPGKNKFSLGLQDYSIFKRYLEGDNGKLRSQQEFLLVSYGVFDWLSLDLKGGAGYIKQHTLGSDELDYPTYLGGGYGFRIKLFDKENVKSVFGFQHISIHPHTISLAGQKHKAVLDDWQFSALVSHTFKMITPYLGMKWSRLDYIHWVDGNRKLVKSDLGKSIGLIAGFDLALTQKTWINLEGEFLDSEAIAFSLNYSF